MVSQYALLRQLVFKKCFISWEWLLKSEKQWEFPSWTREVFGKAYKTGVFVHFQIVFDTFAQAGDFPPLQYITISSFFSVYR